MDIDIYQACPCQSGKKIKFCCAKDILPDLNQILSLHHGKQFVAALEKANRLLEKVGPRACLSALKTHILIHLKDYEAARTLNEEFLRENPRNPLGYQHAALLLAAESRVDDSIDALQNGMDACDHNKIPVTIANSFRTVGMMLMSQGFVVAGRMHLLFASQLRNGEDEVASQLVLQTFRSPDIPLVLKSEFPVSASDDDQNQEWSGKFLNAIRFGERGRWRSARLLAQKIDEQFPDQPPVLYAIAVWSMCLADNESARDYFSRLTDLEQVDHDRAVELRAISLLIDGQPMTDSYELIRTTYEVDDVEKFNERGLSQPRAVTGSLMGHHFIDEDAPPPANGFLILNRDEIKDGASISDEEVPYVVGDVLLFGRQTDRKARAEVFVVCDAGFDSVHNAVVEVFGDTIGPRTTDEVVEQVTIMDHEMGFKWHLPAVMTTEERHAFVNRQRIREQFEIFPNMPFVALDGRTPAAAATDDSSRLDVEALVLVMEQGADSQMESVVDFDQVREKLNLPIPGPVDLDSHDFDLLSPTELQRVDFSKLEDESLIKAYVMASTSGNLRVIRDCGPEMLKRPDMEKYIRFENIYTSLARLTSDTDEALELMQQARRHATAADRPVGGLLIDELELRLERNRPDGCQELLRVLQASHLRDPQNQYRLAAVLQRFGITGPDGRPRDERAPAVESAEAASGEIWTPGDPVSAAAEPESSESGKSKLWLPD